MTREPKAAPIAPPAASPAPGAPPAVAAPCDRPPLQPSLVAELLRRAPGHDLVVPVSEEFPQPLCAVYSQACREAFRQQLGTGHYKITAAFGPLKPLYLKPEDWRPFDPEALP